MPRFTVTVVEEREFVFEIDAEDADEADEIAMELEVEESVSDQFHGRRILHSAHGD